MTTRAARSGSAQGPFPQSSPKVAPEVGITDNTPRPVEAFGSEPVVGKDWSQDTTPPQIILRRGAETGNCDAIRHAVQAGADINYRDSGQDDEEEKKDAADEDAEKKDDDVQSGGDGDSSEKYKAGESGEGGGDEGEEKKQDDKGKSEGDNDSDDEEHLTPAEREAQKREATKKALQSIKDLRFNTLDAALHHATRNGHADAVELLLQLGATIDLPNRIGCTALHTAVSHGHIDIVQLLLKFQAKIDATNKLGSTVLHIALFMQNVALVRLLLQHMKSVVERKRAMEVRNRARMRPLDYALPKARDVLCAEFGDLDLRAQVNDADADARHAYSASSSTFERKHNPTAAASTASAAATFTTSDNPIEEIELPSTGAPRHASRASISQIQVLSRSGPPPDDGDGLLL